MEHCRSPDGVTSISVRPYYTMLSRVYLALAMGFLVFHPSICRHCNVYQECSLVLVNDYDVCSSVFNNMVRLDIHVPEDLHTLRVYEWFSRMMVRLSTALYVICFTQTPVDSCGDFVMSLLVLQLYQFITFTYYVCDCLFSVLAHPTRCFTFLFVYFDLDCISS